MAKKRQREAVQKTSNVSGLVDTDPDLQDSWVIVKKQRVNIILPALPGAYKLVLPSFRPSQLHLVGRETGESGSVLPAVDVSPKTAPVLEKKKIKPVVRKTLVELAGRDCPAVEYVPNYPQSVRQNGTTNSWNPDQNHQMATSQYHRTLGISVTSKSVLQQKSLQHVYLDQGMLVNKRLKARNLERKLQNAGGLSRWLVSLGLEQFVKIFQRKGLTKFHLVNLNMQKLKDMGANAVGPRRKLMHAIECFCQPSSLYRGILESST